MHDLDRLRGRLELLAPLNALLQTASVGAAAERLSLSQPAMSRILGRLRETFSDPLLVRVGLRMELTPRAEALKAPLAELLASAAELLAPQAFDPATAQRTFRGIIPDVVATYLLPQLLDLFGREAPGCRLHLRPWLSSMPADADVDFVITTAAGFYPRMRMEPLYDDVDVLAFAGPQPKGPVLELEHIAVAPAGHPRDMVDLWLAERDLTRNIAVTVPHYLMAAQLLARPGLVAILPSRMVRAMKLNSVPLDIPQDPDRQWLLYPAAQVADPASLWLRRTIARAAA
ncbi:LysR family transcriptional regulator [Phenylobacterium sp.]|jgi:DNA-binding transcriptional LysR family regulator|uniref:LysR family transcriptional regulator n=1 Tax=Phenylobacterium sp. TaxID=1871053 RepID=UPI002E2EE90B|nr:LysR family transcriptional regulator [Phenylobacterium sp.]HEX2561790.1 LysR family transcriptional regulator [Phenylobacterium sp.]